MSLLLVNLVIKYRSLGIIKKLTNDYSQTN